MNSFKQSIKGDIGQCENYRDITLLYKVSNYLRTTIINNRIKENRIQKLNTVEDSKEARGISDQPPYKLYKVETEHTL